MRKKKILFWILLFAPCHANASQMGGLVDALWPFFLAPLPLLLSLILLLLVVSPDKSDPNRGAYRAAIYLANVTIGLSGAAAIPTVLLTVSGLFTRSATYYYFVPLSIMGYALACGIYSHRALKAPTVENLRTIKILLWLQLLPLAYLIRVISRG